MVPKSHISRSNLLVLVEDLLVLLTLVHLPFPLLTLPINLEGAGKWAWCFVFMGSVCLHEAQATFVLGCVCPVEMHPVVLSCVRATW